MAGKPLARFVITFSTDLATIVVDKSYTQDAAAAIVTDGLTPADLTAPYLDTFPYLGVPHSGFDTPSPS